MIAHTYKDKCVDRAISTMRLALGYETGLPDQWPSDVSKRSVPDVIGLVDISFPDREVEVWCTEENWDEAKANHCEYMGDYVESGDWHNCYLFAFCYVDSGKEHGHMVIGSPTKYDNMLIVLAIAVEI